MARIPEAELERLKREVSLVRLIQSQARPHRLHHGGIDLRVLRPLGPVQRSGPDLVPFRALPVRRGIRFPRPAPGRAGPGAPGGGDAPRA